MQPFKECPSFNICSTNICPLDPLQNEKNHIPEDDKCRGEKPTRLKIGSKYPNLLKYQGLTKREWLGRELSLKLYGQSGG